MSWLDLVVVSFYLAQCKNLSRICRVWWGDLENTKSWFQLVVGCLAKCELRGNGGGAHRGVSLERGEAATNGTVMELCCRGSTLRWHTRPTKLDAPNGETCPPCDKMWKVWYFGISSKPPSLSVTRREFSLQGWIGSQHPQSHSPRSQWIWDSAFIIPLN